MQLMPSFEGNLQLYMTKLEMKKGTGIPHFTVLYLTTLCRCCLFYKLKVCDNPASCKSIGAIYSNIQQHLFTSCLCFTFHSQQCSKLFIIIIFVRVILGSVIFDVAIVIVLRLLLVFGISQLHPHQTAHQIVLCVFRLLHWAILPSLSIFSGLPIL